MGDILTRLALAATLALLGFPITVYAQVTPESTPNLPSVSDQIWVQNIATSVTLPVATGGDAPLTYSVVGTLPTGVTFALSTRILSGTPSVLQNTTTYTYKVRDATGDEDTDEFTIAVEADTTPSLTATNDQTWTKDTAVSLTLPAASGGNSPLTYSLGGTLPTGVTFDTSTRVLSGTPSAAHANATYTYMVRDSDGDEASDKFTITVAAVPDKIDPVSVVQTYDHNQSVDLVWGGAPNLNNSPFTRYEIDYCDIYHAAHDSCWARRTSTVESDTKRNVFFATMGAWSWISEASFRIRAVNAVGAGPWSDVAELDPPLLPSVSEPCLVKDKLVSLTLPAASGGVTPLTYSLKGTLPTGVTFTPGTRVLAGTPTALQNATSYTYEALGANAHYSREWITIEVVQDTAPTLTKPADQSWVQNIANSVTLPAASGGNVPLIYSLVGTLPTGVTFDSSTRVLSGTPSATQSATTYTYKVRDCDGTEVSKTFTFAVTNSTPTLKAPVSESWIQNIATSVTLPAASGGDAPLTYSVVGTLPTGVTFDSSTRVLSGTPSATQPATTYTYKVRDANGDEDPKRFTIAVESDSSPSLTPLADLTWLKNVAVSLTLPAASGGNSPLTYALVGTLPKGVTFDTSTRVLSGTPSATQSATTYTYKVRDANGDEPTDEVFTIKVTGAIPTLGSVSDQSWVQNVATSITLPAASSGDAPLTYSVVGSLPTGVTFDTSTRVLSGTPSATQSATTYTYKVRDADGDEDTDEFTIEVTNAPLTLGSVSDQSWVQHVATSVTLPAATGGDAPLTYSVVGSLPTGITFAVSTRILSGTPSVLQNPTTYTYKVVDSSGNEASTRFTILIAAKASEADRADRADSSDDSDPCASIPADMAPIKPLLNGIPFLPAGPSLTSGDKELRVRMPTARTDLAPVLAWNYKLDHYRTESKQGTWTRVPEAWLMDRSIPVNVRDSQAQSVVGYQPTTAADSHRMELLFSQGELAVARGGAASYTVRLATQPSSDVTVTVAAQSESDAGLTASPSHLTFSASHWNRAQVVTISATEIEGAYRQASFEHMASGGGYSDVTGQVLANESDSGAKALAVSVDTLEVGEGNTVTYTLHLASKPDSEVALTIWRTGNADLRVDADPLTEDDQTTLTFTPANWNIPRTITVTAGQDENTLDETALLEHVLAGDGFGKRIGELKNNSSYATCKSVYLLTVQATNRIGVSNFSTAVQATPTSATPVAPANLRAEPGPGQVTLSWSDPNDDSVTGYEYRYTTFSGTAGDSRGSLAWRAIDPTTSHVVKGARFGVRYTFEVRALQGDQRGAISRATAIPALAAPVPKEPTGFAAIWTNSGEARLQWDAEARTAGYEYRYSSDDGASWSEWLKAAPDCDETSCDSTVTVEGNPEAYDFELRRASSDSASSAPISTSDKDIARARTGTHPSAPKAPTLLSSTPEGPTPADRWELEWTAATEGESPTGWQYRSVYLGHRNGSLWTAWTDMQPSTDEGVFGFTVMIDDGEPKGQRMFQVRGTNALGVGEPSNVR